MARGRFPGKRVFLGGSNFRENGARKAFGGSVLNVISITDNASFYENRGGGMTVLYIVPLSSPGRMTVVYIVPLTSPGRITVVYVYIVPLTSPGGITVVYI